MTINTKTNRNVILAYPNLIDYCTLSGGSWNNLPLDNLKHLNLNYVARSTNADLANTKIDLTFDKLRAIRVIVLIRHNLSIASRYKITISNTDGLSNVIYTTDWSKAFSAMHPYDELEWEDENWWGGEMSEEERENYPTNLICVLPSIIYAKSLRIEIDDTTNANHYIEISRLFLSSEFQPLININYTGFDFGYTSNTDSQKTISGRMVFNKKSNQRFKNLELGFLNETEAKAKILEMQRKLDISGELFFIENPFSTEHLMRESFLARLKSLQPIQRPFLNYYSTTIELEEII